MIELEMFVVFFTAIFFTLIYIAKRSPLWGIICYGTWQMVAYLWVYIDPMSSTYSIALFFQGIAILFLVSTIVQWLQKVKGGGKEPSELD